MSLQSSPTRLLICLLLTATTSLADEQPLHQRINQLMQTSRSASTPLAPPASDDEILRRMYLDFTGSIPTSEQAKAFLAKQDPNKRAQLIDQLLDSPEHARHFSELLNVMLLERRVGKNVAQGQWTEFLRKSILDNKPWDQLVKEILTADGVDSKQRAQAKFYLVRNAEPNLVTKDISRLFLGMNLECAQCHDHPIVEEYHQSFYYGIYAFLNRTSMVRDAKLKVAVLSEKADGNVTFTSVFDPKKVQKSTGPRMPYRKMIKEPKLVKGKEYKVKPAKNRRAVPSFSRFALLGNELARADNELFAKNIANRLWALLMGRGLVDPVDMHHPDNPPSHPKVMQAISEEMVKSKFNLRKILRELALTEVYQRSSQLPEGVNEIEDGEYTAARLKPLSPETLGRAMLQASGMTDVYRRSLGKKLNEASLHALIARQSAALIRVLAGEAGEKQEFVPTLDQALYISNSGTIRSWIASRNGNLVNRLSKLSDHTAIAEELYLSVLTRKPTAEESQELAKYLTNAGAKKVALLQDYVWALIASNEFRFNH